MDQSRKAVEKTVARVERQFPNHTVHSVYLTGSRLYGLEHPDSDYDLRVYVTPHGNELLFGKPVSREVVVDSEMVESVKVADVRTLVTQFNGLNFNAMHLLEYPVFGEPMGGNVSSHKYLAERALKNNKRNLLFSMVGTTNKYLAKPDTKSLVRASYLMTLAAYLVKDNMCFGALTTLKNKGVGEHCKSLVALSQEAKEEYREYLHGLADKYHQVAHNLPNDSDPVFKESLELYMKESVFPYVK